jgi:hypothetical protein
MIMSMMPNSSEADLMASIERMRWSAPEELEGIVVDSLEDLRAKFPSAEGFKEAHLKAEGGVGEYGIKRYVMSDGNREISIAYGCKGCEKIVIGSPDIRKHDSISSSHPLSGRRGIDFYCSSCGHYLGSNNFMYS